MAETTKKDQSTTTVRKDDAYTINNSNAIEQIQKIAEQSKPKESK